MVFNLIGQSQDGYTTELVALDQCRLSTPIMLPAEFNIINTPLQWSKWASHLEQHLDRVLVDYIVRGLHEGFRVGFNESLCRCRKSTCNMLSAIQRPEIVREYLVKECVEGRVLGPLDPTKFSMVHTSRFGVIPKGTSGKWRLIVDLSAPEGYSVNDGIDSELCSLKYVSVDDAVTAVQQKGPGAQLAKIDIRNAYRIIPVHPEDRWLLGMSWEDALYIDTVLPFGLRSAPKIFNAVANAVEWIVRQQGVDLIFHYLDDFLLVGNPHTGECAIHLSLLRSVFDYLGIPVASEKLEGPATRLTFLGIEIDTKEMTLRLPMTKLAELQDLVSTWMGKKSCLKRELQSLAGKLQHACKVVRLGRTFLRRIFELLSVTSKKHHHIRLNAAFRSDVLWWNTFLSTWNGISMISENIDHEVRVFTDASGGMGCGAWWGTEWLQYKWPKSGSVADLPITQKEVIPVVLACSVWGNQWWGQTVHVYCDNEAAVAVLNSGYSQDLQIMHLLRCLFFIKAHFQMEVKVSHIPGAENTQADAISRDLLPVFFSQVPTASPSPAVVSAPLLALLVERQLDWTSPHWAKLFKSCFQQD